MQKTILLITFLSIFLISACTESLDVTLLHGQWQAYEYTVSGKAKNKELTKQINFSFAPQQVYTFQGGPIHREAGNYRLERNILYSTDTLNQERIEKAVKITHLTNDTLHFDMNNGGINEVMKFYKVQ